MSTIPQLYGLVLIGGQSTRMGHDKSMINYHGVPQWQHAISLLEPLVDKVFLSVRQGQILDFSHLIQDKYANTGPFGAIMTALEIHLDKAFLVLATDLPNMNELQLQDLINNRDTSVIATAFHGKGKPYPEPLAAIWEPQALKEFQCLFSKNIFKLQRVLKNKNYNKVLVDEVYIQNINTPEDQKELYKISTHLTN